MMQSMCPHNLPIRGLMRGCRTSGNSLNRVGRDCRRYATSKRKPPPPPPPPPSPKQQQPATPKPLPFKPAKPKKPTPAPTPKPATKPASPSPISTSSSSSRGYEEKKQPVSELVRTRWFPLFGAGAAAACVGFFTASMVYYWRTQPAEHWTPGQEPEVPTGRPSIQSPREFDQHLDKSEWRFGITKLRRRIASEMARGHVLEVAVGAGRNFDYYDWSLVTAGLKPPEDKEKAGWFSWLGKDEKEAETEKKEGEKANEKVKGEKEQAAKQSPPNQKPRVKRQPQKENAILSFTGLDISPSMLDLALTRIRQVVPYMEEQVPKKPSFEKLASKAADADREIVSLANNRIRIVKADAQDPFPPPPSLSPTPTTTTASPEKYDTVIQTFGLCSVRDPVRLLSNMAAAVKPETGRIVLLEHGRSFWELANGFLDRGAPQHFARFGCWWNRDIELIVRAAERAVPGLEVLALERPGRLTFGTHILVEMRVRGTDGSANTGANATATATEISGVGDDGEEEKGQKKKTSWWSSVLSVSSKPKKDE